MPAESLGPGLSVRVVAVSADTVHGLALYLERAGMTATTTRSLFDADWSPAASVAVVLFPDEFGAADVVSWVSALRQSQPRLLMIAVTAEPQRIRAALEPMGDSLPPLVLPKPAFSWTILDAIRESARSEAS